jgi:hypothetical protein
MESAKNAVEKISLNGDYAVYTGKVISLHGGTFYEVRMVEGRFAGQTKVTARAPKAAS